MEDLALFAKVRKRGEDSWRYKYYSPVYSTIETNSIQEQPAACSASRVMSAVTCSVPVPCPAAAGGGSLGTWELHLAAFQSAESKVKCQHQGVIAGFAGWNTTRITHLLHSHWENAKIGQRGKQQEECCDGERQCSNMIKVQL